MSRSDLTQLLVSWSKGDGSAAEQLMPLVYDELHRSAARAMRRDARGVSPTTVKRDWSVARAWLHRELSS